MLQPRSLRAISSQCTCIRNAVRHYSAPGTKTRGPKAGSKDATTKRQLPTKAPQGKTSSNETTVVATPTQPTSNQIMRTYKPRTPGVRHLKRPINDHLWKGRPLRRLTFAKKGQARGGRNNSGRITVRHRGGGHKRRIRIVDFERSVPGPHKVERIEHDPNRSAHIALVTEVKTGNQTYIVAAEGMREGDTIQSYRAGLPPDLIKSMGGSDRKSVV